MSSSRTTYDKLKNDMSNLRSEVSLQVTQANLNSEKHFKQSLSFAVLGILVALVFSIVISAKLLLRLQYAFGSIQNELTTLNSNEGDLTNRLNVKSKDELGTISSAFNQFIETIQQMMLSIKTASNAIRSSSQDLEKDQEIITNHIVNIHEATKLLNKNMDQSNASLQEMSSASEEIYAHIENTQEQVEQSSEIIQSMQQNAKELEETTRKAYTASRKEDQKIQKRLNDALERSRAVEAITELSDSIFTITKKTNLLALNASIEAARAGVHGRGFSVVAEEIKNLAQHSQEAVMKIQAISNTVLSAVNALQDESTAYANFSKKQTETLISSLEEILRDYNGNAKHLGDMVHDININFNDIEIAMRQVNETATHITVDVEKNTLALGDITLGIDSINAISHNMHHQNKVLVHTSDSLGHQIGRFKLEDLVVNTLEKTTKPYQNMLTNVTTPLANQECEASPERPHSKELAFHHISAPQNQETLEPASA